FIDVQIKNYSSGMQARLGFAIATVVKPQILICDEVLAVGDYKFQKKCEERIQELMSGETTVILVSHSIEQIRKLCDRVVWLEKGNVRMIGPCEEVCDAYEKE
ncbi:MAG: ABC transporter ATP-binding protein, partial [Oscillospiraceae bacterium]|nr:ABC transporter ATP-binding protein [Oscillospiraceae bacterium]